MGSRYLTDLADVCRRTGLPVIEVDGWQQRARGSGGYDAGRPNHVIIHHTASGPSSDGWPDVNYCCFGDDDSPIGNLYLSRDGTVYVMAGGASNTNGSGQDPCGITPDDSMNSHSIAIEAGNNGTGEPWPDAQQDAYLALVSALLEAYGIPAGQVHSHAEWAPGRKVDPAGPSRWAYGSATWDEDAFRGDLDDDTGGSMALTERELRDQYDRIMGSLPGPYSTEQRGAGGDGDGVRRFALDDQDGNYIVTMLQTIAAMLQTIAAQLGIDSSPATSSRKGRD